MHQEFGLLSNLAISLVLALVLGLLAQRLKLSPIVGYLLAGIALGPQTPGFVADAKMASEFAEIGVVLLMFGVGLHFHLRDLLSVKWIAVPGAVAQFVVATSTVLFFSWLGGVGLGAGLILGIAVSIASTVVVIRVLMEGEGLNTPAGHAVVGWLIVQDIFTVLVLVAMPALGAISGGSEEGGGLIATLGFAALRLAMLIFVVGLGGSRLIPWLLQAVAKTRSRELFTLSILAIALAVAVGSSLLFGVSMALGAFLAGMVVGQTDASHQAAADALPMRDAFAVLFFVSVGMLFDPSVIYQQPFMLCVLLFVVLIVNPVVAFAVSWAMRCTLSMSLTVAALLTQIGEFSFLLASQALDEKLLTSEGRSLLVACSIVTIAANPWVYSSIRSMEELMRKNSKVWNFLKSRSEAEGKNQNAKTQELILHQWNQKETPSAAVIVGYGPVGQTARRILEEFGMHPVVIDLNLDTVRRLNSEGCSAIYGDATHRDILLAAGILRSKYLLVTLPEVLSRSLVIMVAKELHSDIIVFARARYINERAWLEEVGATGIVTEEGETAVSLAVLLLEEMGADRDKIKSEIVRIQEQLQLRMAKKESAEPRFLDPS